MPYTLAYSVTKIHTLEIILLISGVINYAKTFQGWPDVYVSQMSKPFTKKARNGLLLRPTETNGAKLQAFRAFAVVNLTNTAV